MRRIVSTCLLAFLLTAPLASPGDNVRIKVRVMDIFTQLPVADASLMLGLVAHREVKQISTCAVPPHGLVELELTNSAATYEFEIKADGYSPHTSTRFTSTNVLPFYDVALYRQKDFEGIIIAPSGHLASGAQYFLCTDVTEVTFRPDRTFFTRSKTPSISGARGRFRLSPEPNVHSILAAHDLGYALVSLLGWTNGSEIRLKPWGQVAGRMFINGKIARNERIALAASENALGRTRMTLLNFEKTTDEDGRFDFENVPPTGIYVCWMVPTARQGFANSHRTLIQAGLNESAQLTVDLRGRDISGSFRPIITESLQWGKIMTFAHLFTKPPPLPVDFWRPDSGFTTVSQIRRFALTVGQGLSFSGRAIPPGDYFLSFVAIDDQRGGAGNKQHDFQSTITIPPGDAPLDLGQIVVTNTTE